MDILIFVWYFKSRYSLLFIQVKTLNHIVRLIIMIKASVTQAEKPVGDQLVAKQQFSNFFGTKLKYTVTGYKSINWGLGQNQGFTDVVWV